MERRLITSGSPYEPVVGFSRAVVAGRHVFVAGTAPVMPEGAEPPADTYGQTRRVLEIILQALAEAGAGAQDVVRTRVFLTPEADFDGAARAHGEVFSDIRPASTMLYVSALADPRWHIEMEAEALLD
jgi:enamine deaminase RidA (YjgF/YER057c/UK114 family)